MRFRTWTTGPNLHHGPPPNPPACLATCSVLGARAVLFGRPCGAVLEEKNPGWWPIRVRPTPCELGCAEEQFFQQFQFWDAEAERRGYVFVFVVPLSHPLTWDLSTIPLELLVLVFLFVEMLQGDGWGVWV